MLSVWGSNPLEPGRYAVGLGMQVRPLLVSHEASGSEETAGAVSTVELLATVGLWRAVDVSAGVTAHSGKLDGAESRDAAASQAALGDARFIPRLRLVGGDTGAGLAVAVPVWIPAGDASVYRTQGIRVEPRVLAGYFGTRVTISADAGYLLSRPDEGLAEVSRNAITAGVGADVAVLDTWSIVTELSSRWYLQRVSHEDGARLPMEARSAARFTTANWIVQLGGGLGLQGGPAQPDWRLLAAVGFSVPEFQRQAPQARPSDRDGDGTPDKSDQCPDEAEDKRAAGDVDGCPLLPHEHVALVSEPQTELVGETPSSEYPVDVAVAEGTSLPQIEEVLYFELNKMDLEPAQLAVLDLVEAQLRSAPADALLVIEGHSDGLGPPSFNSSLSWMRASTVRLYLIQRGISWRRLLIAGHGSSRPVELDIDDAGRARNRRVEFRLTRN